MRWIVAALVVTLLAPQKASATDLFDPRFALIAQFAAKKGGWFPAGQFTVTTNGEGHVGFVTPANLPLLNPMQICNVKFIIDSIAETHAVFCDGKLRNDLLSASDADRIRTASAV